MDTEHEANKIGRVDWSSLSTGDKDLYCTYTDVYLNDIEVPKEDICCKDVNCNDVNHIIYSLEVFFSRVIEVSTTASYITNDVLYNRLYCLEDEDLEVIWVKVMPKRLPRTISCILVACVYYTQHTDCRQMRDHLIIGIDSVIRKHPQCGVIVTGVFNQLNDNFLKSHYSFVQIVNVGTRGHAVLDKIWTNIKNVYMHPVTIAELDTSDHNMVLLKPIDKVPGSTGSVTRYRIVTPKSCMRSTISTVLIN